MSTGTASSEVRPSPFPAVMLAPEVRAPRPEETPQDVWMASDINAEAHTRKPAQAKDEPAPALVATAQAAQAAQTDMLTAQDIYFQMALDRRKAQQRMIALLADLQTSVFEMWQEVLLRREKTADKIAESWARVLDG